MMNKINEYKKKIQWDVWALLELLKGNFIKRPTKKEEKKDNDG